MAQRMWGAFATVAGLLLVGYSALAPGTRCVGAADDPVGVCEPVSPWPIIALLVGLPLLVAGATLLWRGFRRPATP